jgi:DNA (cytosine-5)-methyltransferase 1
LAYERFSKAHFMKSDTHSSAPLLVDLFCGAGGLSTGLEQAGFRPVVGVDFDRHAIATYARNHPSTIALPKDITKVSGEEILAAAEGTGIDLIAGGPSCQGYSTHGKRVEDDPRNFLFKQFVRIVREVRPKFFLMENVKGLLTYRSGRFKMVIEDAFASAGYQVVSKVLCAADYGVPQLRHRIVFLGTRTGVPLSFPEPTHGPADSLFSDLAPYVTVGEALGDLPLLNRNYAQDEWEYLCPPESDFQRYARKGVRSKTTNLHQAKPLSPLSSEIVALVKEGQGLRSISPDLLPERFRKMRRIKDGSLRKDCTTLYYRISRDKPSYTITCHFRNVASGPFVHPVEDRCLTYREAARLMSFQDSYVFEGSMRARQIGNAVPPLLAKALGIQLIKLIKQAAVQDLRKAS